MPKGRETKFLGLVSIEVSAQGDFPPVGGSRGQRVDAWALLPEES